MNKEIEPVSASLTTHGRIAIHNLIRAEFDALKGENEFALQGGGFTKEINLREVTIDLYTNEPPKQKRSRKK